MYLIYRISLHIADGFTVHARNFKVVCYKMEINFFVIFVNLDLIIIQKTCIKLLIQKKNCDTYVSMKKNLKNYVNFDPSIDEFWLYDFKFNWKD